MKIEIKTLSVTQDENVFYIGKIKAKELAKIATTKVRRREPPTEKDSYFNEIANILGGKRVTITEESIEEVHQYNRENTNNQREQSIERLKEIGEYIEKANSIVPNAIICNLAAIDDEQDIYQLVDINEKTGVLSFDSNAVELSIIDGQHRLGGFGYTKNTEYYLENYELIVTLLIGLKPAQQAELFATINGKQKSVNKSILYDLSGISEMEYSEQLSAHLVITWFNINPDSPLRGKIKMLGTGAGYISQAAMIDALVPLFKTYKKGRRSDEKIDWPVFNAFFRNKDMQSVIQNLYDYFYCISDIFSQAWNMENSEKGKSVLLKTTGFTGLMLAYPLIYTELSKIRDEEERYSRLYELIEKAYKNDFQPYSDVYQGGGKAIQKQFANEFLAAIFTEGQKQQLIEECVALYCS